MTKGEKNDEIVLICMLLGGVISIILYGLNFMLKFIELFKFILSQYLMGCHYQKGGEC
jgi:hypothetical protein